MKNTVLLNSEISFAVARMGHTDTLVICDAGLSIPKGPERIDLAVTKGIPTFLSVLESVLSELEVQKITIASEMKKENSSLYDRVVSEFSGRGIEIVEVSHLQFKKLTKSAFAVVRTGEFSPFANIILEAGVTF